MTEIRGLLHDGRSSRTNEATLRVWEDGTVRLATDEGEATLSIEDLSIPPRLGSTARRIALADGGEFETPDNDRVDAIVARHGAPRAGWLHRLESRWTLAIGAAVLVLGAAALFGVKGIPAIAREAAYATPPETSEMLARGTMEILDQSFEPSELPAARADELRAIFERVTRDEPDDFAFELVFRGGGLVGANAFALPSGTIVLTDELVALAEHDEEIEAVLAHEVGHVVHRHGLRQAIQNSMLAVGIVLLVGDLSAASGLVAALPTALAEASFSREFELEADEHARAYLELHGIDPARLAHLLVRMEESYGEGIEIPFLSTHPATEDRIRALSGDEAS